MSTNITHEDEIKNAEVVEQPESKATASAVNSDSKIATSAMNDKSIQIDMDCEPGEDPKKNKKYWQDLAGLRGAREQYLQLDNRDLGAVRVRQSDYINYLKAKLEMANKEIETLKTKCRCRTNSTIAPCKPFSSIGL